MNMNTDQINELIQSWAAALKSGLNTPIYEENSWAIEKLYNLPSEDPELLWLIVLKIIEIENDEELLGSLAAGPLEDLMCSYGEKLIDRVEIEARKNPKFKSCIQGVWLDSNDTPAYKRFYEIAGINRPFD